MRPQLHGGGPSQCTPLPAAPLPALAQQRCVPELKRDSGSFLSQKRTETGPSVTVLLELQFLIRVIHLPRTQAVGPPTLFL